jgi:hypothetical protein
VVPIAIGIELKFFCVKGAKSIAGEKKATEFCFPIN